MDRRVHMRARVVGAGALDRRIFERTDPIELGLVEPREQLLELGLGLPRETDDEGAAKDQVRADTPPLTQPVERTLGGCGPLHTLQYGRTAMLKRDVEIRQNLALGHQR